MMGEFPRNPSLKGELKKIVEVSEKVEGQQFTRGVENTDMTDCISSL
jgi:hypothetical protein